ncbi:phosphatase PAP2 family protein [Paenibacillus sp. YN15]|uniref:phosphatase PAP2 family protein n=1 Tax=Paenibacillus sp. YN15 TaxID=1742774 RepID=UPI000DCDB2B3|nr:phosphatase PAP2 family protein [Paenibacillus sp. YN15]RAV06549.1 phospholipid phosphatase [Paenibacillus sp. YN15]
MRRFLPSGYPAAALAAACSFVVIAAAVRLQAAPGLDEKLAARVQSWESPGLTLCMTLLSWIGTGLPLVLLTAVIMGLLYHKLGFRREIWLIALTAVGSALLNVALKHLFRRPRPEVYRLAEAAGFSFPSGHSMAAFSLYGLLAFLLWPRLQGSFSRTVLLAAAASLILAIGLSRIYLGVHYPSDVLGGYAASACWIAAVLALYRRLTRQELR